MSAWRDNEREVAVTRHARQAGKRASTLPPPLRLSPLHFALPIVFASLLFFLATYLWGAYVPPLCAVDLFFIIW